MNYNRITEKLCNKFDRRLNVWCHTIKIFTVYPLYLIAVVLLIPVVFISIVPIFIAFIGYMIDIHIVTKMFKKLARSKEL